MVSLRKLYEQALYEDVDSELSAMFKSLESGVASTIKKTQEEQLKEGGAAGIIGLVLSGPFIIKIFGKFIKYAEKLIGKFKKAEPTTVGDRIIKFAEHAHHVVMIPFYRIAKVITNDTTKQKKFANYMFHGIIGMLLLHGGYTIVKNITSNVVNINLALDIAKNTVKGVELTSGIRNIMAGALAEIGEDVGEFHA